MKDLSLKDQLAETNRLLVKKLSDYEDMAVYSYIKSVVESLVKDGKDITQYSLIRVSNPRMLKNGAQIEVEYKVVPISEIENIPTYDD